MEAARSQHGEAADDRYSREPTEELFVEYARTRDTQLRERLILLHQNLVRFLAGKFANRGVPLEDLVQVGMIGLINAVDRYEPEKGFQFSTYATPTIVGEIKRYFRDKAWTLKVPRRLQELNQAVAKAADELARASGREPTINEIATHLGVTEEETLEAVELGNAYDTVSLDAPAISEAESESGPMSLAEFVGVTDSSIARMEDHADLWQALESLEPRERAIIYYRFFLDMPQTEVARRLQISQMHVSRLQQRAISRLKELLSQ